MESVDTEEEFNKILVGNKVVVDFWANWCGPCKMFGPTFEEVSKKLEPKGWKFVKVDIDKLKKVAQKYEVMSIPAIRVIIRGERRDNGNIMGNMGKEQLTQFLESF